jgi:hypothetical protein
MMSREEGEEKILQNRTHLASLKKDGQCKQAKKPRPKSLHLPPLR